MATISCNECGKLFDSDLLSLVDKCPECDLKAKLVYCLRCKRPTVSIRDEDYCPSCLRDLELKAEIADVVTEAIRKNYVKGVLRQDNPTSPLLHLSIPGSQTQSENQAKELFQRDSEETHRGGDIASVSQWTPIAARQARALGLGLAGDYLSRKICQRCGERKVSGGHGAKYCLECRPISRRQKHRETMRRKRGIL